MDIKLNDNYMLNNIPAKLLVSLPFYSIQSYIYTKKKNSYGILIS